MSDALVSIVIPTKNSLPHLINAINGIRAQTYRNIELIIQDGGSTDGTLEYLATVKDLPKIDIFSAPDSGIGQAYNRGLSRCHGNFIFLTASDECLFPDTLEHLISSFKDHPSAALISGGVTLVDSKGQIKSNFTPQPFDFLKIIKCEMVLSTANLLNKKIIGSNLFYDESLKTCPDYDFWLRIGNCFSPDKIICQNKPFMSSLADRTSMSYRAEAFEQFCQDKCFILDRFLSNEALQSQSDEYKSRLKEFISDLHAFSAEAKAGILTWAFKQVMSFEGITPLSRKLCYEVDRYNSMVDTPPETTATPFMSFTLYRHIWPFKWLSFFRPFSTQIQLPKRLRGGMLSWMNILTATLTDLSSWDDKSHYWVKIRMQVFSGAIGICFFDNNKLQKEKTYLADANEIITYYPLNKNNPEKNSIVFRNGGFRNSSFKIYELSIVQS